MLGAIDMHSAQLTVLLLRLKALEGEVGELKGLKDEVAALADRLKALENKMRVLKDQVIWLLLRHQPIPVQSLPPQPTDAARLNTRWQGEGE